MLVKQLSVFLENKKGKLHDVIDILAKNGVDISALSLADTSDFGILRLIVDRPEAAQKSLMDSGITVSITDVVAVAMNDVPGGALGILSILANNDINIDYMYACVGKVTGKALMVLRVEDNELTERILFNNGYSNVKPADIYRI